jgi:hypothetical protein
MKTVGGKTQEHSSLPVKQRIAGGMSAGGLQHPNIMALAALREKLSDVPDYAIPSLNHSAPKRLPATVKPKGTQLSGLTATLHRRTDNVAWYIRNDGYNEVFLIQTGPSFDKSCMMEYYPGNNDFGITAWCIRDIDKAARYYANLCSRLPVNERTSPERYKDITGTKKRNIGRTQYKSLRCALNR